LFSFALSTIDPLVVSF